MGDPAMRVPQESDRGRTRPGKLPLYQLAYDQSIRALDDQLAELEGMRQRTVQFLAFVGAATAFLAGAGLRASTRDWVFYLLAGFGSAVSVAAIVATLCVLASSRYQDKKFGRLIWDFRISGTKLVGLIEPEVGGPDEVDFLKFLAVRQDEMRTANETNLDVVRTMYYWALGLGGVQVLLWATLVWVKG